MSHLYDNIEAIICKCQGHDGNMAERFPFDPAVDVCCAGCKYGSAYRDAVEKQQRRLAWLLILLRKAQGGRAKDRARYETIARDIQAQAWP